MNVVFVPAAQQDLTELLSYIRNELQNPIAADNIAAKILRRVQSLGSFPEMGASLENVDVRLSGYRYLVIDNYLIIYNVANQVKIVRILYARSDYVQLLRD
jgi:addiction module RelE/StbE family toxin